MLTTPRSCPFSTVPCRIPAALVSGAARSSRAQSTAKVASSTCRCSSRPDSATAFSRSPWPSRPACRAVQVSIPANCCTGPASAAASSPSTGPSLPSSRTCVTVTETFTVIAGPPSPAEGRFPSTIPEPVPEPAEPAAGHPPGNRPRSPPQLPLSSAYHQQRRTEDPEIFRNSPFQPVHPGIGANPRPSQRRTPFSSRHVSDIDNELIAVSGKYGDREAHGLAVL